MPESYTLTEEEREILQELMNIAFGKSAADLADVINTHVELRIPDIKLMPISELPAYVQEKIKGYTNIDMVEQSFYGRFKGDAVLVFSQGAGRGLISLLQNDEHEALESDPIDILETETLMEAGNILISACVGKFAEMLKDVVTYAPPMVVFNKHYSEAISLNHDKKDMAAIVMKTDFTFTKGDVSGFLFLITAQESIKWLKEALQSFMEQYE
ncbi:MAG: chemotaxis protein CheC [Nitrospirae bacterium]|nr:chemotaxis protein CheC [Nitrospirota bacterium]